MQENHIEANNQYVLAFDLGTSGVKVGLVNLQGKVVASASGRYETNFLPNGGAEQNPEDWWSLTTAAVRQVIHEAKVNPSEILAIGTTSQWSVTLPVDEDGTPLMNAISWMDGRGGKYNSQIVKGFPSLQGYAVGTLLKWINIVGAPPTHGGSDVIGHILFIKHELPEIYRKTYKFLEPMDFINMRLTGKATATQNTNVATLMIDNRKLGTLDYHPWTLERTGIDRAKLPDLLPVDGIIGSLTAAAASELGLSTNTIVITGSNDNSSSAIGAGAVQDYEAAAVLGTSGMLVFHLPYKKTDLTHMVASTPSALPDRYLFTADTGNTGRVIDSFIKNMIYPKDSFDTGDLPRDMYDRLNRAAEQVSPGSDGVLFLPWFNGTLAPAEDPYIRGGFLNLSNRIERKHMARAVLEGIAYNWRWLREAAEAFTKQKFAYWRLTGGGALSDIWAQIMADVIGIPMHQQADPRNNNVLGVAFLAFNRLGLLNLDEVPGKISTARIYQPQKENQAVYDRMYRQFRASYKQTQPIFHGLNKPSSHEYKS